ncbi:hypothetical protein F2Q69_00035727 [Brassica cretica]|uniref:Uncharacterized protein n=1 Tax=Brassica cretica TaxID=69181 RepID=A0A8S9SCL5_BRACR|nr:hypothetical protein F2Q69_00035727 [Brassica cretica]
MPEDLANVLRTAKEIVVATVLPDVVMPEDLANVLRTAKEIVVATEHAIKACGVGGSSTTEEASMVSSDTTESALSQHSGHDRMKGKKKKEETKTRGCVVGVSYITTTTTTTTTVTLVTTMLLSIRGGWNLFFLVPLDLIIRRKHWFDFGKIPCQILCSQKEMHSLLPLFKVRSIELIRLNSDYVAWQPELV